LGFIELWDGLDGKSFCAVLAHGFTCSLRLERGHQVACPAFAGGRIGKTEPGGHFENAGPYRAKRFFVLNFRGLYSTFKKT